MIDEEGAEGGATALAIGGDSGASAGGAESEGGNALPAPSGSCAWNEPFIRSARLPPPFNAEIEGTSRNDSVWFSPDTLTAFVSTLLADGNFDIYETHRPNTLSLFEEPIASAALNTEDRERQISLSEDRLTIVYQNDRTVLMSRRVHSQDPFPPGAAIPDPVNVSGSVSGEPFLTARAERLYFLTDREQPDDFGIYVVELDGEQPVGSALKVVDTPRSYDGSPVLSADELTIYYQAGQPPGIWVSSRPNRFVGFDKGEYVASLGDFAQFPELLSGDGCSLYYARHIGTRYELFVGNKR